MTSRERVLAALEHRETDRVPVDLSGHRSSGLSASLYPKVRSLLGLPERPVRVYDLIQQLAVIDPDLLDLFGIDTIELGRGFSQSESDWSDWVLPDGTPCQVPSWSIPEREGGDWILRSKSGRLVGRMPDGGYYFDQVYYPYQEADDRDYSRLDDAFDEAMWMTIAAPPGPVSDRELVEKARKLRNSSDRAILGLFGGNLLESGQILFRNDVFLMLLAAEPDEAHTFLDALVERHLSQLERFLGLVGPFIDIIVFGDDLGMQTGPQISPAMYREFFKPRHARLWARARELAEVKIMLHCCGGVRPLLPDLIDAGLDAINPVQVSCRGMEADQLKRDFGERLTFWGGGCDTHRVLPSGTPDEVREHVRRQIQTLRPGGGFVFQQVHNILPEVPPENVIALFEAVNRYRGGQPD
ncbi:MAG: methyltransferase [Acidobacteriota bacterium]|nr:MAG: methyltransferase [Acidobacteriota bacterium]